MTTVTKSDQLIAALAGCKDGDTITVKAGVYEVTPEVPENIAEKPYGGAPLVLAGKKNVTVTGEPGARIYALRHGSTMAVCDCTNCTITGLTFLGCGYCLEPKDWYFAAIYLGGVNEILTIEKNIFQDQGNFGIGHLMWGATNDSMFRFNHFIRGGFLNRPGLGGDGAAIANGGTGNSYWRNVITEWLRGIELETKEFPGHDTATTSYNIVQSNTLLGVLWHGIMATPTHGNALLFSGNSIARNLIVSRPPKPPCTAWQMAHPIYVSGGVDYEIQDNVIIGRDSDYIGIDVSPSSAPIHYVKVVSNKVLGVGRSGISFMESQGVTSLGITNCQANTNFIDVIGRGIWYEGEGHEIMGNTIVRNSDWEPLYSQSDPQLTACKNNVIL